MLDTQERFLGDREFPADHGGYQLLLSWRGRHSQVRAVGVEGTGSYGAGLTRLTPRLPLARRWHGDRGAERRDGIIEAIRVLRTARRGAGKTGPGDQPAKGLLVTAPASLQEAPDDRSAWS